MKSKDTTAVNIKCESRVNKFSTYLKNAITTTSCYTIYEFHMAFCETTYKSDVQNLYHELYLKKIHWEGIVLFKAQ